MITVSETLLDRCKVRKFVLQHLDYKNKDFDVTLDESNQNYIYAIVNEKDRIRIEKNGDIHRILKFYQIVYTNIYIFTELKNQIAEVQEVLKRFLEITEIED